MSKELESALEVVEFDIDKFIFNATVEALRERGYPEEDAVKRAEELLSLPGFWKTFGDVV